MASKFAVLIGGNWNTDATWSTTSGGIPDTTKPTAADDVFLDANSGAVAINGASVCRSINCTGYTGVLTHNSSSVLSIGDSTTGAGNIALKLVSGMTYTLGSVNTSTLAFVSTSSTQQTIDFGGKSCGSAVWTGNGGNWQLSSAFTAASTNTISAYTAITGAVLDFNNQNITCFGFSSTPSQARTLSIGSSAISISGTAASVWNINSGITLTANTAAFTLTGASPTFAGGAGLSYGGSLTFSGNTTPVWASGNVTSVTRTGGAFNVGGDVTCTTLTYQGEAAARIFTISAGKTITMPSGSGWLVNGSSGKLISIVSGTPGSQTFLVVAGGTVSSDYLSLTDSWASGGSRFFAGANSTNVSNNSGWVFTAPTALSMGVGTGGMRSMKNMQNLQSLR